VRLVISAPMVRACHGKGNRQRTARRQRGGPLEPAASTRRLFESAHQQPDQSGAGQCAEHGERRHTVFMQPGGAPAEVNSIVQGTTHNDLLI
jgi:hypothetical protein